MATDFTIKRRDQLPPIQATLRDATNTIVNLTAATVRFIMVNKDTGDVLDQPATVVDANGGVVRYDWVAGDTDTAGNYSAEFEVTFASGKAETFPNSKNLAIKIPEDLGGVST